MSEDSNGNGDSRDGTDDRADHAHADGDDPLSDRLGDEGGFADADHDPEQDPFERISEGTGPRHGDPFDSFQDDELPADDASHDDSTGAAPTAGSGPDPARDGLPSGLEADDEADDPFTEFDEPTTDPFAEGESVFEGATAGETGDDGVWERMESTDSGAEAVPGKPYVDVNKHAYCETCEYFSAPPEITCSHEGTEILEFVDVDTVRVANCHIVAERKALDDDG